MIFVTILIGRLFINKISNKKYLHVDLTYSHSSSGSIGKYQVSKRFVWKTFISSTYRCMHTSHHKRSHTNTQYPTHSWTYTHDLLPCFWTNICKKENHHSNVTTFRIKNLMKIIILKAFTMYNLQIPINDVIRILEYL